MSKFIQQHEGVNEFVMEVPSFAKYGLRFQEILVQQILDDRAFADQIGEVLDPNFLESKHLQAIMKLVYEYRDKFKTHPTKEILHSLVQSNSLSLSKEAEVTQQQVSDFYNRILNSPLNEGAEYVRLTSLDFCRKQKIRAAMLQSVKLLKDASFDEIQRILSEAMKLGSSNDAGTDFLIDFEKRYQIISRSPISTGWSIIDNLMQGGLGIGELGVCIAPPGRGKSHLLVHLGAEAVKLGKNVVHYTLELSEEVIAKRYDACISGFKINELSSVKSEVFDIVKTIPGRLIIKQYPTKTVGTNAIRNHLDKQISHGFKPDMIIVDYGDLLKPPKGNHNTSEKRFELELIFEDLRAIAIQYKLPCWTASQTTRSSAQGDIITLEDIAEAYSKCYVADFIMSLSRTRKDIPIMGGRVFVAKNRNGFDNLVYPIHMDTTNTTIRILPKQEENNGKTVEEINADAEKVRMKEGLRKLKELYKTTK